MDTSTSLRIKMAERGAKAAEVAAVVGRTYGTIARWRRVDDPDPIPLDCAQMLYRAGFLHAEALLGEEAAA